MVCHLAVWILIYFFQFGYFIGLANAEFQMVVTIPTSLFIVTKVCKTLSPPVVPEEAKEVLRIGKKICGYGLWNMGMLWLIK